MLLLLCHLHYLSFLEIVVPLQLFPFSPHYPPLPYPPPASNIQSSPTLLSLPMGPLYMLLHLTLPLLSLVTLLPHPLWSLSVCSKFPSLWFYFARLFVLLIRFHLQVRSYGICLLPPAYFTQHNALQFHPCCCKGYKLLLSPCCIVFHCVNVPQFFDPLIY